MLHPSYNELIDKVNKNANVVNNDNDAEPIIQSRYSIVIASAKRARQLIEGDEAKIENAPIERPLSVAVAELYEGLVHVVGDEEDEILETVEESASAAE